MTHRLIYTAAALLVAVFLMARMPVLDDEQTVADDLIQAPIDARIAQREQQ